MAQITRYARNGDVNIAFQVHGDGPLDLLFVSAFVNHVEHIWEEPGLARFLTRLTGFARLIVMDRRGSGLSDDGPLAAILAARHPERVSALILYACMLRATRDGAGLDFDPRGEHELRGVPGRRPVFALEA